MADITMSLDDTLELDAIIEKWNNPTDIITDSDGQFNISGFQTNTGVLDPQNPGEHKIVVNGQELTIKVTDTNRLVDKFQDNDLSEYTVQSTGNWSVSSNRTYNGSYSLYHNEASTSTRHITSLSGDGLNHYPSRGDTIISRFYHSSNSDNDFDCSFTFFVDSLDTNNIAKGYRFNIDERNDNISIKKYNGTTVDSDNNPSFKKDEWMKIKIETFNSKNEINAEYIDSSGNSITSLSGSDSDYPTDAEGGIGWIANSGGGRRKFYADSVEIR